MNAQYVYKTLCESFLPPGPCGFTVEDIENRISRFQGPYKYSFDYHFQIFAPFVYKKQAMFEKFLAEQKEKPKEKAKPKKDELTVKVEKENSRVTHEWDAL